MRTIIDLTPEQIAGLERYRARHRVSRAAAVREAVDRLLREDASSDWRSAFGAWAGHGEEARALLAELRAEWDRD